MQNIFKKTIGIFLLIALIAPTGAILLPTSYVHAQEQEADSEIDASVTDEIEGLSGSSEETDAAIAGAGGALACATSGLGIGSGVGAATSAIGATVPVLDIPNLSVNTSGVTKECVLDGLATVVREVLIASMTRSIVNWINGGFNGEPAFVTDLEGFLLDVGDQVVGAYIEGVGLGRLCSPFDVNVRVAIALNYYASSESRHSCTLTGVLDNIGDAFDDFKQDLTWDNWFQFSINPSNNALGSYLSGRQALRERVSIAQSSQLSVLNWGSGYRSHEVCDTSGSVDPNDSFNVSVGDVNCRIATPGATINATVNEALGTGQRQLELADEINEIIGALLGQLSNRLLGGSTTGLRGLSQSNSGRSSYVNQLVSSSESRAFSEFKTHGLNVIEGSIAVEQSYVTQKQVSLQRLNASETKLESLRQCYADKLSGSQLSLTTEQRDVATQRMESASSTIASTLSPLQTAIASEITQAEDNTSDLLEIQELVNNTSSQQEVEAVITNRLDPLIASGLLHTETDFFSAEQQKEDVQNITESLDNSTDTKLEECSAFPNEENNQ